MSLKKALATTLTVTALTMSPLLAGGVAAQQSTAISEAELEAFVGAYKDVVTIEQEYGSRLQGTEDEAEQQAIINEAQTEMTQAVEDAPDIGVDRYVEILQLAQNDPELQAQLNERIQD